MPTSQPRFTRSELQILAPKIVRAAQYLRASTNNQIYSIANQKDAIAEFARKHDIKIVRTYLDPGRSGVTLRNRPGLRKLISDIEQGRHHFETILVFDVSRWGRFQDTDESAHYEFLCKIRGVTVQYCAEPFDNTLNLTNTVLKNMKRAMAGEYSRDLSGRVHRGQLKLAGLGFSQGGTPRFGFRRLVVDEQGKPKGLLKPGERKYLSTDRVVLVHGPRDETDIVREIFELFVERQLSKSRIATILNTRGISNARGVAWSGLTIDKLLRCEKYIGNAIYNKTSLKLGQDRVKNPKALWVRAKGKIQPIVSEKLFNRAQNILNDVWPLSDNDLLDYLSSLWCRHGLLTGKIIDRSTVAPSTNTFCEHFGSLSNTYRIIGYKPAHRYRYRGCSDLLQKFDRQITAQIIADVQRLGGRIILDYDTHVLRVDEHLTVAVTLVPYLARGEPFVSGWKLLLNNIEKCHAILMVRLNRSNTLVQDHHLLPRSSFLSSGYRFTDENIEQFSYYKLPTLSKFYEIYRRNWFTAPFYAQEKSPHRPFRDRSYRSRNKIALARESENSSLSESEKSRK